MKVREMIELLNKIDNKELEVDIKFAVDKDDEIGYYLIPAYIEKVFEDGVTIYAEYKTTKEDCDFIGQVDLKEAYQKIKEIGKDE